MYRTRAQRSASTRGINRYSSGIRGMGIAKTGDYVAEEKEEEKKG